MSDSASREYGFGSWSRGPAPRIGGRPATFAVCLALVVLAFATTFALYVLLSVTTDVGALSALKQWAIGLVLLQGISMPGVVAGYLAWQHLPLSFLRIRWPSLRDLLVAVGGFVLAFGMMLSALTVVSAVGLPTAERADSPVLRNPRVLLAMIPVAILLIGPSEELLFRGVIQTTLRGLFDAPAAIVLTSLTFAPAHVLALRGSPAALAVTIAALFVPSLAFGAVYEYTENLAVPALSHGLYNAVLFGLSYLAVTAGRATLVV